MKMKSKSFRNSKRSQMEAFGLAMIVILVILGLFIFLVFKANDKKDDPPDKEFKTDELAVNFINTIINVDVKECDSNRHTVAQLIRECAKNRNALVCSNNACELANRTIYTLLNRSLIQRRDAFIFNTTGLNYPSQGKDIHFAYNCRSEERGQAGSFPVSLYPEPRVVYLNLVLCKQ